MTFLLMPDKKFQVCGFEQFQFYRIDAIGLGRAHVLPKILPRDENMVYDLRF